MACFAIMLWLLAALPGPWPAVSAMKPSRTAVLRQQTVDMFYHGFTNYMDISFPEDEVSRLHQPRSERPLSLCGCVVY